MMQLLKAERRLWHRRPGGTARIVGRDRHGEALADVEKVEREPGAIFTAPETAAASLIARGAAVAFYGPAELRTLCEAVLRSETPARTALAAFDAGFPVWHGDRNGPAGTRVNPAFDSREAVAAHWAALPDSTPIFTVARLVGMARLRFVYRWTNDSLIDVPETIHMGREQ